MVWGSGGSNHLSALSPPQKTLGIQPLLARRPKGFCPRFCPRQTEVAPGGRGGAADRGCADGRGLCRRAGIAPAGRVIAPAGRDCAGRPGLRRQAGFAPAGRVLSAEGVGLRRQTRRTGIRRFLTCGTLACRMARPPSKRIWNDICSAIRKRIPTPAMASNGSRPRRRQSKSSPTRFMPLKMAPVPVVNR
jgi:hypothetical protein